MYFLRHVADAGWFEVVCNRATIAHLTGEKLGALLVLTPSLLEQRAIADFLDRKTKTIDDLIQKKERLIELLQEKRQALITQAVTKGLYLTVPMKDSGIEWLGELPAHWELAPIYARYEVQLGKMLDAKRITGEHLAPYLRNVDVQWDSINLDNLPMMDFTPTDRAKFTLEHGDLLVCEGGEVGRCAVWQGEIEECYYQKALHRVRPWSDRDNSRFLYYVMFAVAKRGVFVAQGNPNTIDHLTAEKLRRYRFPFPPRYEQDAICSHLDAAEHRAATTLLAIEQQIDRLREYRQVGLDHGVGHLISMTAPGNHRLDIDTGCNTRATSPSLASYLHHDSGLRKRRKRWAPSSNIGKVSMMTAINTGTASNALRWVSGMAICKPKASPSVKRRRCLTCLAAHCRPGGRTKSASMRAPLSWRFFTVLRVSPSSIGWCWRSTWCIPKWVPVGFAWCASC